MRSGSSRYSYASPIVQFIWRTHLLHPQSYAKDCEPVFGAPFYPKDRLDLITDARTHFRGCWSIFSCSSKFASINLVEKALKHYQFIQRVLARRELYRKPWYQKRIQLCFLKFILDVRDTRGKSFTPSTDVDFVWHTYMLNPQVYCDETHKIFGQVLAHHTEPTDEKRGKEDLNEHKDIVDLCKLHLYHSNSQYLAWPMLLCNILQHTLDFINPDLIKTIVDFLGEEDSVSYCKEVQKVLAHFPQENKFEFEKFENEFFTKTGSPFVSWKGGFFCASDLLQHITLNLPETTGNHQYRLIYSNKKMYIESTVKQPELQPSDLCRCCSPEWYVDGMTVQQRAILCKDLQDNKN